MAAPERIPSSRRLRTAAQAERERLARNLDRLEQRTGSVRQELGILLRQGEVLRGRLALLAQLANDAEEDSALPLRDASAAEEPGAEARRDDLAAPLGYLRGAAIRMVAVRLLAASPQSTRPIHYARWYELLQESGYGVGGREPLATFLTQLGRSPVVERAGEPGMYALDLDAPTRLRERLHILREELVALHEGQQTIEEIASVRERRGELTKEYGRVERALEEALEALGAETGEGGPDTLR